MFEINKNGFSLTELLTVIAIIAILAAVGSMSYLKYISYARLSKMKTVLERAKLSVEEYYAEYDKYLNGTCNFLENTNDLNVCAIGNFRTEVPGRFCVKFKTIDCGGSEGYEIIVSSTILKNGLRTGPALIVYHDCLSGGDSANIICTDNEIYGQQGNCTSYSCP